MNDLIMAEGQVLARAKEALLGKDLNLDMALGHDNLALDWIIAHDNPTNDLRYRQAIRELWTRWEAWTVSRYIHDKTEAEVAMLRLDMRALERVHRWIPWRRARTEALMALQQAEIDMRLDNLERLRLDFQHRTLRETKGLLERFSALPAPDPERRRAEMENLRIRAERDPNVKQVMAPVLKNGGQS